MSDEQRLPEHFHPGQFLGCREDHSTGEVVYPTTDEGWCEWYKALDKKFGTPENESPLSHGWRCPIHGTDPARVARREAKEK